MYLQKGSFEVGGIHVQTVFPEQGLTNEGRESSVGVEMGVGVGKPSKCCTSTSDVCEVTAAKLRSPSAASTSFSQLTNHLSAHSHHLSLSALLALSFYPFHLAPTLQLVKGLLGCNCFQ